MNIHETIQRIKVTKDFKEKLRQNFSALTYTEAVIYLVFIRPFFPKKGDSFLRDVKDCWVKCILRKGRLCTMH